MLSRLDGERIDRHDIVLRMNHAPTVGYSKAVGARTDARIDCPPRVDAAHP